MAGKENQLRIDLHVHSRLSKNFDFSQDAVRRLRDLGSRRGLDGLALTEHIHAKTYWRMHEELRSTYNYRDSFYELGDGFRMFSGCEVTVGERVDFIVVGDLEQLQCLDAAFYPRLSEANFPPGIDFLRKARDMDLLVIAAHPYRPGKELAKLPLDEVFSLVDAVEVNGRDYGTEHKVAALAREYDKPVSGGSDAHYYLQVGVRSTVVLGDELLLANIRRSFAEQTTTVRCKPYTEQLVKLCKELKNVAKLRIEATGAVAAA
jgi:predicted metal-dependent phosphoesterase TrpH